jgi:putative transposase
VDKVKSCGIVKLYKEVAMTQRKQFPGALKAKVAIEAIKSEKTVNEIATIYQVHPKQVYKWKKQALELLPKVMADKRNDNRTDGSVDQAKLYQQIGQLTVEVDFLKKKLELLM